MSQGLGELFRRLNNCAAASDQLRALRGRLSGVISELADALSEGEEMCNGACRQVFLSAMIWPDIRRDSAQ